MKNYIKIKTLIVFLLYFSFRTSAQQILPEKFILPDGTEISPDKLDSVKKAWNGARILFQHNKEDDENHVMHLIRMNSEMAKTRDSLAANRHKALQALIGRPAPDFTLTDMAGRSWTLRQLRGRVVVLNFWFTSCPPCIQEMPQLNDLVKKYNKKNVAFLALTFDDRKTVNTFLKKHDFNYTLLPSSKEVDKKYQISSWPASFVINGDGKVKEAINATDNIFSRLSELINEELLEQN